MNGQAHERAVEPRATLADFLSEDLDLTGTHVGCEHGVCGACTVLLDGEPVRACLMLAVQVDGAARHDRRGRRRPATRLHPIQEAFWAKHGLQCGFCTPGIMLTAKRVARASNPRRRARRFARCSAGNLCRCTGYHFIVEAIEAAAQALVAQPRTP